MRIAKYIFAKKIFKKTEHPVLSFDSDDWGVAKIEQDYFDAGAAEGLDLFSNPFVFYDSLENVETFNSIKGVLSKYKGYNSTVPSFTLNYSAFNPDFERIKASSFKNYYNIPLERSYKGDSFELVRSFILNNNNFFDISFHCAQHINIYHFLSDGRAKKHCVIDSAKLNSTNISDSYINHPSGYMDELSALSVNESRAISKYIIDGVNYLSGLFENNFQGIITPTCGAFDKKTLKFLLPYFQYAKTSIVHYENKHFKLKKRISFSGKAFGLKLVYRLIDFDPTICLDQGENYFNAIKKQITYCFKKRLPVIVSTHRLNYSIGHDNGKHSDFSLQMLDRFLNWLVVKYKDIEFLTTKQIIERYRK